MIESPIAISPKPQPLPNELKAAHQARSGHETKPTDKTVSFARTRHEEAKTTLVIAATGIASANMASK